MHWFLHTSNPLILLMTRQLFASFFIFVMFWLFERLDKRLKTLPKLRIIRYIVLCACCFRLTVTSLGNGKGCSLLIKL